MDKIKHSWCHRHLVIGWGWIVLAIPSLIWWKESIILVILLSLYANAESSFSAHHAKMAEQRSKEQSDDDFDPCDPS